jgi:hypothetical protein
MPGASLEDLSDSEEAAASCSQRTYSQHKAQGQWVKMVSLHKGSFAVLLLLLALPSSRGAQPMLYTSQPSTVPSIAPTIQLPVSAALFWRNLVATGGRSIPPSSSVHAPVPAPGLPDFSRPQRFAALRGQDSSFGQLPLMQILTDRGSGDSNSNSASGQDGGAQGSGSVPASESSQSTSTTAGNAQSSESGPNLTLTPVQLLPGQLTNPTPSPQPTPTPMAQPTPSSPSPPPQATYSPPPQASSPPGYPC